MKVFLSFALHGERDKLRAAMLIAETLEKLGHDVVNRKMLDDDAIKKEGMLSMFWRYENSIKSMKDCDCVVAEVSRPSFGVGYELGYALAATKKKVFIIYDKNMEKDVSVMATGNSEPNAVKLAYTDDASLKAAIAENFRAIEVKA